MIFVVTENILNMHDQPKFDTGNFKNYIGTNSQMYVVTVSTNKSLPPGFRCLGGQHSGSKQQSSPSSSGLQQFFGGGGGHLG